LPLAVKFSSEKTDRREAVAIAMRLVRHVAMGFCCEELLKKKSDSR
jgi:hypothetical protein